MSERKRQVVEALVETQGKLDRELGYSEDLQKPGMIAFYRGHIAKLQGMIGVKCRAFPCVCDLWIRP